MSTSIERLTGEEAYGLIFPEYLSKLPVLSQETMHRAMHNSSRVWIGCQGDDVLAVWGLIPPTMLSDQAYLWLYTTEHLHKNVFGLVRYSKRGVEEMLREFPTLLGHCLADAKKSHRWLRWLGAEFGPPQGQFLPFEIKAKSWPQE